MSNWLEKVVALNVKLNSFQNYNFLSDKFMCELTAQSFSRNTQKLQEDTVSIFEKIFQTFLNDTLI